MHVMKPNSQGKTSKSWGPLRKGLFQEDGALINGNSILITDIKWASLPILP